MTDDDCEVADSERLLLRPLLLQREPAVIFVGVRRY